MEQARNLRAQHFKDCQPHLEDGESGFLRNGELPDRYPEDFKMVMSLIGMSEKSPKPKKVPTPSQKRIKGAAYNQTPASESEEDLEYSDDMDPK